eukprot:TRINITY_DN45663_c0_g1_i1.p1 TRINITY_DN45663_c0_g1~~TRINITY_DN45663_c0_g1_i1.p1  ORF type:complete len:441 (+),score=70.76 TRINITY_DN45663_c0_g1_i1:118-1440(+)
MQLLALWISCFVLGDRASKKFYEDDQHRLLAYDSDSGAHHAELHRPSSAGSEAGSAQLPGVAHRHGHRDLVGTDDDEPRSPLKKRRRGPSDDGDGLEIRAAEETVDAAPAAESTEGGEEDDVPGLARSSSRSSSDLDAPSSEPGRFQRRMGVDDSNYVPSIARSSSRPEGSFGDWARPSLQRESTTHFDRGDDVDLAQGKFAPKRGRRNSAIDFDGDRQADDVEMGDADEPMTRSDTTVVLDDSEVEEDGESEPAPRAQYDSTEKRENRFETPPFHETLTPVDPVTPSKKLKAPPRIQGPMVSRIRPKFDAGSDNPEQWNYETMLKEGRLHTRWITREDLIMDLNHDWKARHYPNALAGKCDTWTLRHNWGCNLQCPCKWYQSCRTEPDSLHVEHYYIKLMVFGRCHLSEWICAALVIFLIALIVTVNTYCFGSHSHGHK